ncbi:hypothetical protein PV328_012197 [Microctonus aethiopoides]|uniref:Reverse transcriptase domain-containing protein n=1 Tax=Microctonus aethiopoides TaxID=144406 RepID=A0AA39FGU2_9HYME|nr:hypothetical protein PV328_012197 [Microctonus aethiopoides]
MQLHIINSLEELAPLKRFKLKKHKFPWVTTIFRSKIKQKNRLYKHAKRSGSILDYEIYKQFRNDLSVKLKEAKNKFIMHKLKDITDTKVIWREISSMGLVKTSSKSPFNFFTPNMLMDHFEIVSKNTSAFKLEDLYDAIQFVRHDIEQFQFVNVDNVEIHQQILSSVSNSHTIGPDGISPSAIKMLVGSLTSILSLIYNYCVETSLFPDNWKKTHIKPLLKVNLPKSPADTRPIASLCELSKVFEKLLHKQIINYLNKNSLWDPFQTGFRKFHSTQTALIKLNHDVRQSVDKRKVTILVLFDFSKAFDMVPHGKLLIKLAKIGFSTSSLKLICSYLTNRQQCVIDVTHSTSSHWSKIINGVPQGSVLGPLLFSLYISDISKVLKYSKYIIFADDVQIYRDCVPSEIDHAIDKLRNDINAISQYAIDNDLKLNLDKTKILIMGSASYINNIEADTLPVITINQTVLPYVQHARNLGVILQSSLSWSKHVTYISSRVHTTLYRIKLHNNSLSVPLKTKLVTSLIFPILDYCCVVYNDVTVQLNLKLQRLMNSAIRFIYNIRRDEHITPFRLKLRWLTVRDRRKYFMAILVYKILFGVTPDYIKEIFELRRVDLRQSERNIKPQTFQIPNHRTSLYSKSFHIAAINLWHSLPTEITSIPALPMFKRTLHDHLLNNNTEDEC